MTDGSRASINLSKTSVSAVAAVGCQNSPPCGGIEGHREGMAPWLDVRGATFPSPLFPLFSEPRMEAPSPLSFFSNQTNVPEEATGITPQDSHTCVCKKRCQLVLCLGRKHRCNPLQNLDCPLAFAVVKLLKNGRTEDSDLVDKLGYAGEDAHATAEEPRTVTDTPQTDGCPIRTAEAVLVIFKGKFATLVLNGIASLEDALILEGLRCRPFFRPGKREDLYSWASECLHQLRMGQSGGEEVADPVLRHVCTTHYLTMADVYDDAKITIQPQSPSGLPAFSLSAPELVTCSAFPSSLPLPDWLVTRNAQAARSIFASRVLKRSSDLRKSQDCAASSASLDDNLGATSSPGSPRRSRRTTGPSRDSKTGGRSASASCVPLEREGDAETAREGKRTSGQASGARGSGAREGAADNEYVYTDLASLQANRGTNLYGIVWEVGKALMPQPSGKSQPAPPIFLMNVAIFDETVKFDVGRDTAPGGSSEEFSLALKAKGCPADIPCMSCGDIVRVHRSNVGMKLEHDRNYVNLSSVVGVTSARVWPIQGIEEDPTAENGVVVGKAEATTHFSEEDVCRIRALRYYAQQLLQDNHLFTTQYYKPLAELQRCSSGPMMREVYGDLIVRVVKSSMTSCCRLLDLGEPEGLFSDFSWVRGDSSCPALRQFDSELSAYLLLIEDASLPGGLVAVVNLSSASAEQLFVSENPIKEGQWLRLRNFKWSSFRLHDTLYGRIYFCVQPSRSDLARITRLPHFALDALRAQRDLDLALQVLVEEEDKRDADAQVHAQTHADAHGGRTQADVQRVARIEHPWEERREKVTDARDEQQGVETTCERAAPSGQGEEHPEESLLPVGALPCRFEFFVPKELLDRHPSVSVYKCLDPLLASSRRTTSPSPRRMRTGPFLLKEMHVIDVGPRSHSASVDLQNPRTWLTVQCLICRSSRPLEASEPDGGDARDSFLSSGRGRGRPVARAEREHATPDEPLWCPTCRHRDAAMLLVMYDFRLVLADAHGTHLIVDLKDAVGSRFSCVSAQGISPLFAATDSGARELLRSVLRGLVDSQEGVEEEHQGGGEETEEGHRRGSRQRRRKVSARREEEREETKEAATSSSEEEGEVQTQSLVGRKYMRQRSLRAGLGGRRDAEEKANEMASAESGVREKRRKTNLGPGRHELLVVRRPLRDDEDTAAPVWVVIGADIREA
ncbi:hypothetical protein TGME49_228460 [Toxoplasma gondii ME49]|uniref:Uncharacterized protein n=1 Tax=Toxoplasma gondii (strain ATCC 50611 / Me49) TaxID=508771 RepID=S8EVA0_TOXGM|nr:hypothetical protein TGME49_228460 [Toxoplasma gondii ME49]EPT27336.1 hypothetical protein TGME49_228460 [Toxoplasma gondii ME49]|eukprot:XP_018636115.1 hypothetical protein TGME49_228460 [Toxoplasma gondii ME49]